MEEIIVVSGLPRSGTSLMMQILQAGGITLLTDNSRKADLNNPQGYYEFDPVKQLQKNSEWLSLASGKAVKIISHLLKYLPDKFSYKIFFMERDINEIINSQNRMLDNLNNDRGKLSENQLKNYYTKHLKEIKSFINNSQNFEVRYISFQNLHQQPQMELDKIRRFLSINMDSDTLKKIIKPDLYRNRL